MGSVFRDKEEHLDYPALEAIVQWTSDGTSEAALLDVIFVGRNSSLPADAGDVGFSALQAAVQGFLTGAKAADVSTTFGTFDPPLTVLAWNVYSLEETMTDVSANFN